MRNCKAASLLSILAFQSLYTICVALPSLSTNFQLSTIGNGNEHQSERKLADCIITQAQATDEYRGGVAARGVFFTFQSQQDADLLSIEFAVGKDSPQTIPVQIYFRQGSFSGVSGRAEEWTKVADTSAQLSPETTTAIVPVLNFQTSTLAANTEHALYVSMQTTDTLFAKLSTAGIGAFSNSDGIMERSVGVAVNDGPFPESLASSEIAEFMGVLHYKSKQECSSVLITTNVELQFAINDIPDTDNLNELAASFGEAVNAIFVTNSTLSDSKRENMISVNSTDANFKGRSDVCPASYEICALVYASAQIEHLPRVTPGQIRRQLLDQATELASLVKRLSSHAVEIVYVGGSTAALLTAISFQGVPSLMDETQQRYFNLVFTNFLQGIITDMDIHEVVITSQAQTARRRALRGMDDHDQRELQSVTVTSTMLVYGIGGTVDELRALVFDAVLSNQDTLIRNLKLEGLRPGFLVLEPDINVDPSFFTGLQSLSVAIPDTGSSGGSTSGGAVDGAESSDSPSWQIILGAIGVALSSLFLIYRIYKDMFHSEKLQQSKLPRGDSYGLSDSTNVRGVSPLNEEFEDEVVEEPDLEEVEVVASPRGSRKPDIEEVFDEPPSPAKPDLEEVHSSHPSQPPTRGVARSRSLEPSMRLMRVSRSPPAHGDQARGRSISPSPGMGAKGMRPMSQERLRPKSQERLRPKSQERLFSKFQAKLRPQSQERPRSRSNEGLTRGVDRTQSLDPSGAAKRYLQERNQGRIQAMSQSSHDHDARMQKKKKNQMMSQSAHDPRMRPSGGRGGRGPKPKPRPRPRSQDRSPNNPKGNPALQRSFSSLGEKPLNKDYDSELSDVESESGSFARESFARETAEDRGAVPPPPPTSPPPPPPSGTKATPASSSKAHVRFKDDQMALYSPEEGTGMQLVQIIQVQCFKGKKNIPCYKIRLQGSNVEKTMVKETLLMELGEVGASGGPAVATPASRSPKSSKKPTSSKSMGSSVHTPGKKKKKKKKTLDSSVHSTGDLSAKKKKKKKKSSRSISPTRKTSKGEKAGTIKKTRSLESLQKKPTNPQNGVKGNEKWDSKPKQPALFKLPRRTKTPPPQRKLSNTPMPPQRSSSNTPMPQQRNSSNTPMPPQRHSSDTPRRTPSNVNSSMDDEDLESVESELSSVKLDNEITANPPQQSNVNNKPEEIYVVQEGETHSSSSEDSWDDSYANGATGVAAGKSKGVNKRSSKEQMKQRASAESKTQKQKPEESSSEESDLEE